MHGIVRLNRIRNEKAGSNEKALVSPNAVKQTEKKN